MLLKEVRIQNYRAILNASVTFNRTTVLIGENECGKSSILEAIQLILNPTYESSFPELKIYQYHFLNEPGNIAGPVHIMLLFEERSIGEWSGKNYQRILAVIPDGMQQKRELEFELTIKPPEHDSQTVSWRIGTPGTNLSTSNPEVLRWLRKMNPVIYLNAGMLTGHGKDIKHSPEDEHSLLTYSPEIRQFVSQIHRIASTILLDKSTNILRDIDDGYNSAMELIEQIKQKDMSPEMGLGQKIREILGIEVHTNDASLLPVLSKSESTAQRLGVLLLVAALLKASSGELMEETEPILIIENPEANLHPMTLSSMAFLINSIHWQKIIATYSDLLLNSVPLSQVRRLTRYQGHVQEYVIREKNYSREDLRRIGYHLQVQHSTAIFARMWLLVEGESEFWIVPQLARLMNYDFSLEGIVCMDFAQSGLTPIIRVAQELGIEWHLLADGDSAGQSYLEAVRKLIPPIRHEERMTQLRQDDIELYFWMNGYAKVYVSHARISKRKALQMSPGKIIHRAIKNYSKPYLALSIVKEAASPGSPGIPLEIKGLVELCVKLAREAPERNSEVYRNP